MSTSIETHGNILLIKAGEDGYIEISAGDGVYNSNPVIIRGSSAITAPEVNGGNVSIIGGTGEKGGDVEIIAGEGSQTRGEIRLGAGENGVFLDKDGTHVKGPLTVEKLQVTQTTGSPVSSIVDSIPVYDSEGVLRGYIPICK